jgi:hypothetical protein
MLEKKRKTIINSMRVFFLNSYLPSAINVQLLKFFVSDRLDNIIIVRTFPGIPIKDIIILYGIDICIKIL